jgi:predicted dinucleotide-binding enzyme
MPDTVGFIGLGNMGGPLALNLARAGFPLVVHGIDSVRPSARAQKRRPRIILMISPSVAWVRPTPTPKLISQRGSTLRSTTA